VSVSPFGLAVRGFPLLEGRSWHHVERPCRWRAPLRPRTLPKLNTLWVICDHTSGSAPGYPTPAAQVADIDLAVGRLVAAISHSKDYKDSAVFVIEDDSQDGVDHIDGHRNVTLIASPYALRQTGFLWDDAARHGVISRSAACDYRPRTDLRVGRATPVPGPRP